MLKTRRIIPAVAAALLAFVLAGSQAASGASAHFVGGFTTSVSGGTLTVGGKAAGLGDGPVAAFLTASQIHATYDCHNKGGNVAPGQPIVVQNVQGPTVQISPHNGQITFSVSLSAPAAPNARDVCPNGNWSVVLTSLSFSGVVVHVVDGSTEITADLGNL